MTEEKPLKDVAGDAVTGEETPLVETGVPAGFEAGWERGWERAMAYVAGRWAVVRHLPADHPAVRGFLDVDTWWMGSTIKETFETGARIEAMDLAGVDGKWQVVPSRDEDRIKDRDEYLGI